VRVCACVSLLSVSGGFQNYIREEIKSLLNSGNRCYSSIQSPLYSLLLSKNLKIKIYKTIILPAVLYGCET
jgi:hypothetical protein